MRILKALGLTAVFCLMAVGAQAQSAKSDALSTCGSITYDSGFARNDTMDTTGRKCVNGVLVLGGSAVSSANPLPVSGPSGAVTQSAVNVTNASTSVATAAQFANFGTVCVPQMAANGIWLNWAGVAAVTAPPSELLQPGECKSWVKTSGFMPTGAWAAISASASTIAITVEGN